ncbi:LysR family transcriptional regulator [Pontivivens insulae]|uniref:Glycine cleavage system transcriptional activator n=1 Tax=Pontivivens insulae TaxID=1639689 RepID=A0A2R8AAF1_9RHOB|nr:LysR family transcriptional regulator [Pontivivens insulae]RED13114.1 LysR family glycine cleavage system transcriptional activator [Pontivivens insulae]SPF29206.1 Glycine cleavage system transcriptional activator [Pontivivens insulae]
MSEHLPSLAALRAFEVSARLGNFSAAARELNVTPAAVAQQVRGLERDLAVPLAVRAGRGIDLTADGLALARDLSDGFTTIRQAVERIRGREALRPVSISTTPSFAAGWFMPRLPQFWADNPGLELALHPSAQNVDLTDGQHDLAIRFGGGRWAGLEAELLLSTSFVVCAAPELLQGWRPDRMEDLLDLPWFEEPGTHEQLVWLDAMGLPREKRRNVTQLPGNLLLSALREGQGVAASAMLFVEDDVKAGRLVKLWQDQTPGRGYYIVHRPGVLRPQVERVRRWLRRQV